MKKEILAVSAIVLFAVSFVLGAMSGDAFGAKGAQADQPSFESCNQEINSRLQIGEPITISESSSIVVSKELTKSFAGAVDLSSGKRILARCVYVSGTLHSADVLTNANGLEVLGFMLGGD